MTQKTSLRRLLVILSMCLACCVVGLFASFISNQKTAVAEDSTTLVAGTGYTATATANATGATFVAGGGPVGSPIKYYINGMADGQATVINFANAVSTKDYPFAVWGMYTSYGTMDAKFELYKNESGVVIGQTPCVQTFTLSNTGTTQKQVKIDLARIADQNGMLTSFVLYKVEDSRTDIDPNLNIFDITLTESMTLVAGTDFNAVATAKATGATFAGQDGVVAGTKLYVNNFAAGKATVIKFNSSISSYSCGYLIFNITKNINSAVKLNFYKNESDVVIGTTDYVTQIEVTSANSANFEIKLRVKDFADENGNMQDFIIYNANSSVAIALNVFNMSVGYVTDSLIQVDSNVQDMVNGGGVITANLSAANKKYYANGIAVGQYFTMKFVEPIDAEFYSTLYLKFKITSHSAQNSFYIDLFGIDETNVSHETAATKYTVLPGIQATLVVDLKDIVSDDGQVYGFSIMNNGNTSATQSINCEVYESVLGDDEVVSQDLTQDNVLWAMPEKTAEKQVFVGWDIDGNLYPAFTIYSGEEVLATPVYVNFYMKDGAQIRLSDPSGIRFGACVSKADWAMLGEYCKNGFGFTTVISSPGAVKTLEIPRVNSLNEDGDNYLICALMYNVHKADYDRTFVANSYLTVNYISGVSLKIYGVSGDNARSLKYIAETMLAEHNGGEVTYTEAQLSVLNSYAGVVA